MSSSEGWLRQRQTKLSRRKRTSRQPTLRSPVSLQSMLLLQPVAHAYMSQGSLMLLLVDTHSQPSCTSRATLAGGALEAVKEAALATAATGVCYGLLRLLFPGSA
jgi:hypothetical protein